MKLKLNKKIFINHLEKISKAIITVSPLPSLQGILITATESNIELITSDGNLSIREIIENNENTNVIEPGKILIPGRLFKEVISKQGENIEINTTDTDILINSDGSKTHINLLNINDYPIINFEGFGKEIIINSDNFKKLIKNISYAAADNDKRIILNGVNIKGNNGELITTATNSFRLAQEKININSNIDFDITVISKNLKDFLPNDIKGEIKIIIEDSKIISQSENTTISSKLIDGVYPEVDKLIPVTFNKILKINKKTLENAIEKTIVISNDSKKVIKLTIENNLLKLESRKSEIGDTEVKIENINYEGEKLEIAFNSQFLKDALSKIEGNISLMFNGQQKPFVIKSELQPNFIQLILPHRSF